MFHPDLNTSSNPDTTDTEFTWGGWYYYTDFSTIDNVELDMNQVVASDTVAIFAAQCDLTKTTPIWEFVNHWQNDSNIQCPRSQWTVNRWHHIVINASRTGTCTVSSCTLTYYSVSFDGATTNCTSGCVSASNAGAYSLNWTPVGLLLQNVQFGVGSTDDGFNTAYADLMTVHSGPPTTVATPQFSLVTTGTSTNVTISTSTDGATICYTTDGTTPTANGGGECSHGDTYSGPFTVSESTTVAALGSKDGIDFDSSVATD